MDTHARGDSNAEDESGEDWTVVNRVRWLRRRRGSAAASLVLGVAPGSVSIHQPHMCTEECSRWLHASSLLPMWFASIWRLHGWSGLVSSFTRSSVLMVDFIRVVVCRCAIIRQHRSGDQVHDAPCHPHDDTQTQPP